MFLTEHHPISSQKS